MSSPRGSRRSYSAFWTNVSQSGAPPEYDEEQGECRLARRVTPRPEGRPILEPNAGQMRPMVKREHIPIVSALSQIELFRGIPLEALARLAEYGQLCSFRA